MITIGISAHHPDAACVILRDGKIAWAAEEERFNRIKHFAGFPTLSLIRGLKYCGLRIADIDQVALARDPKAHIFKKMRYALLHRPPFDLVKKRLNIIGKSAALPLELSQALGVHSMPANIHYLNVEHHLAHTASSFYMSGFKTSACMSIDGLGDFVSLMRSEGDKNGIRAIDRVYYPDSIGFLYTAGTQFIGFKTYGDEFKIMGLASYGKPVYLPEFRKMVHLLPGGLFKLNLAYFAHQNGPMMRCENGRIIMDNFFSDKWKSIFGPERQADAELTERDRNIACSMQALLEETYSHALNGLHKAVPSDNLCLAGGVALNGVANGKVTKMTPFKNVYVQGAAGDSGIALGAALVANRRYYGMDGNNMTLEEQATQGTHACFGPDYSDEEILEAAARHQVRLTRLTTEEMIGYTASKIADKKVVGWFQGRMEYGPRALGQRSILADPRDREMMSVLNQRIKRREIFRPFAPAVPVEKVHEYFRMDCDTSPFMIKVFPVKDSMKRLIPAVTHVDGSARVQTVDKRYQPLLWNLLMEFGKLTGIFVLLNTSFNENEPIVCSPDDAIKCFLRTKMDILVLGNFIISRESATQ